MDLLPDKPIIQASLDNVISTMRSTKIGHEKQNVSVTLIEHVLAALRGMDVDNCLIQVKGPEVPILDGSALPFCEAIEEAGGTVETEEDRVTIALGETSRPLEISVDVDFTSWSRAIGVQLAHTKLEDPWRFIRDVAPARTFALLDEIQELQRIGILQGVRPDNTIMISAEPLEGMRFENEIARHKLLDVIGDLALIGKPIVGTHLHFEKPGHTTNIAWCKRLFAAVR